MKRVLIWIAMLAFGCNMALAAKKASDGYTIWSADNIKMVHLQDSTQYVCDPDHILSELYRDSANYYLNKLNREFDVQSVFVVVNHVKNADAFRMAQDIGNKYGVGFKDTRTGLVIVIAVADKQFFIATGKGLEAYLPDITCNRIANGFLKPNMRDGNTDLAVAQTCKAIYMQVATGELPPATSMSSGNGEEGFTLDDILYLLFIICLIIFLWKDRKNPPRSGSSSGSFGGGFWGGTFGGGGSSGGGFGGGSFGGGSFGGGGAGGSW